MTRDFSQGEDAYKRWKAEFTQEYLPGKSPNPFGDQTDWATVFEQGRE